MMKMIIIVKLEGHLCGSNVDENTYLKMGSKASFVISGDDIQFLLSQC
jgi:hypothetical protein